MEVAAAPRMYPVRLEVDFSAEQSRWKALLRLPLSIPLLVVLAGVQCSAALATLTMWAAIIATGRPPRWLFDFIVAAHRWSLRATAYVLLLTDEYAPFGGSAAIQYDVEYPEAVSRWRVALWKVFTSFAHLILLEFLWFGGIIVVIMGWFAIIITGRFPPELHSFVTGALRWATRVLAYLASLTDAFPPFGLSHDAGRGGRAALVISCIVGVPASLVVGVTLAASFIPWSSETVDVSYARLVAGDARPGENLVEVSARNADWIDRAPRGTVELTGARDPATGLGTLFVLTTGNRFVQFDLVVASRTYGTLQIETGDFSLKDRRGERHRPVLVLIDGVVPPRKLRSGDSVEVAAVFQLPRRVEPAELRFSMDEPVDRNVVYRFK